MKLLKAGRPLEIWWIGIIITCPQCGQQVQLEAKDSGSPYWYAEPGNPNKIGVSCSNCNQGPTWAERTGAKLLLEAAQPA